MSKTVLVVDDSLFMRSVIRKTIEGAGYRVIGEAATGEQALDMAFELQPNYITLDIILPDMIGIDLLEHMRKQGIESKIIMVSAVGQECVVKEGMRMGAKGYLVKPFTADQLIDTMSKV